MTSMTRRLLLRSGAAAAGATVVGLRPWSPGVADAAMPRYLRRSTYLRLRSRRFTAHAGGRTAVLRLVSAKGRNAAFSLTFAGPLGAPLEAGTHTLRHPALGRFQLFLSPVGAPGRDLRYEAVIDRRMPMAKARRRAPRRRRRGTSR
jgi:hypothetical protein